MTVPDSPARHPRRKTIALCIAAGGLVTLALALFAFRPAPVLGIDGGALQHSVGGSALTGSHECRRIDRDTWSCSRFDSQFSSTIPYRVTVDGLGCWKAERMGNYGEPSPKRLSGCLTIASYLFG